MRTENRRYALVGTGSRAVMYLEPLAGTFREGNLIVGLCDTNPGRLRYHQDDLRKQFHYPEVPAYAAADFDRMVRETKPDVVIVSTVDAFHHYYVIRALELGSDTIVEKPMTIDDEKCRAILDAVQRTGRQCRVTFNYRWSPGVTLVRRLLSEGVIGEVLHVDMEYLLNTRHGANYFRRWHREKDKSGGLLVHKSTHHFDLVNWWLDAVPETVFAFGRLAFYGRQNAQKRGLAVPYDRYAFQETTSDPFARHIEDEPLLRTLYLDNEPHDGYCPDRNVFGDNITAEDTMSVLVKYRTGPVLNYSLNAYLPREGFHVVFNGTKGRLEYSENHETFGEEWNYEHRCIVHPMFGQPRRVEVPTAEGGHGGGDPLLQEQMFSLAPPPEPWGRNAGHEQGAASILIGIAANRAIATGLPVSIRALCPQLGDRARLQELI